MNDLRDMKAVVGWFLSGYEDRTYVDHETGERHHPLGEIVGEIREQLGIDLAPDVIDLIEYSDRRAEI